MIKKILYSLFFSIWFFPLFSFAACPTGTDLPNKVTDLFNKASGWLLNIIIALSVIMILIGAFNYTVSGGDEKKTQSGKNYIIYASVGLALALLAKAIVSLIQSLVC